MSILVNMLNCLWKKIVFGSRLGLFSALAAIFFTCSCAFHGSVQSVNGVSEQVSVDGHIEKYATSIVADFRVLRLQMPLLFERGEIAYLDEASGRGVRKIDRTSRTYRLDLPVLTIWDFDQKAWFRYPGLLEKRTSLDIWLMGQSNFSQDWPWMAGAGVSYYQYKGIAAGVWGGWSTEPFRDGIEGIGPQYPQTITGRHEGFWVGVEVTLFAGEFALELWDYLVAKDEKHRELFGRQSR